MWNAAPFPIFHQALGAEQIQASQNRLEKVSFKICPLNPDRLSVQSASGSCISPQRFTSTKPACLMSTLRGARSVGICHILGKIYSGFSWQTMMQSHPRKSQVVEAGTSKLLLIVIQGDQLLFEDAGSG